MFEYNMTSSAIQDQIANGARKCWDEFHKLITSLNDNEIFYSIRLDFEEEFKGFQMWCKNAGAFAEDHASLDYRARDNAPTRKLFLTVLQGLTSSLLQCFQIVTQKAATGDLVAGSSEKSARSDSESNSEEPSLEVYLDDVVESVNKLVKITRAIRQSSAKYRSPKAQAYEDIEAGPDGPINHSEIFENFIGEYLSKRYHETNGNIRARLQSAISRCRRNFAYRRRYQQKLFYGGREARSDVQAKPNIAITPPLLQPAETNTVPVHVQPNRIDVRPNAPSAHMTASTLRPDFRLMDIKSSVVSGSSYSRLSRDPIEDLPPAPPLRAGERYFQCPYCRVLLPHIKSNPRDWRKHVISDLQPFVCVFEECSVIEPFFESKDEWIQHERGQHNLEWNCDGLGSHAPILYTSRQQFQAHFTTLHAGLFAPDEIAKLTDMSARPSSNTFENCPFCDYQVANQEACGTTQEHELRQGRFEKHVLDHMVALFIMALPERNDLPDAVSSDSNSRIHSIEDYMTIDTDIDGPDYVDPEYSTRLSFDDSVPNTSSDMWDLVKRGRIQSLRIAFLGWRDLTARITNNTAQKSNGSRLSNELDVLQLLLELWIQHIDLDDTPHQETFTTSILRQMMLRIRKVTPEPYHDESEYMILGQLGELGQIADNMIEFYFEEEQLEELIIRVHKLVEIVYSMLKDASDLINSDDEISYKTKEMKNLKETIVRWLSPLDFLARQEEILDGCIDTSQWLIESEEFRAWRSGRPWTLYVEGAPGTGKTVLTSLVVNHLRERFRHNRDIAVLCIYLNYKESDYQNFENLISSLLKQVIQQQNFASLPSSVLDCYEKAKEAGQFLSENISNALSLAIKAFEKVYLIVDALDESQQDKLTDNLKEVFSNKLNLMVTTRASNRNLEVFCDGCHSQSLKIFFQCSGCPNFHLCQNCIDSQITCGHISHLLKEPYTSVRLEIRTPDSELRRYVESVLEWDQTSAPFRPNGNSPRGDTHHGFYWLKIICRQLPRLVTTIPHTISQEAAGNFLVAKLHMHYLQATPNTQDVEDALANLPKELETLYHGLFNRIFEKDPTLYRDASKALAWVAYAHRPLSAKELRHAIVFNPDNLTYERPPGIDSRDLRGPTAGLIAGMNYESTVQLIHQTAQDYFDRNIAQTFPNAAVNIALKVIRSLCTDALLVFYPSKLVKETILEKNQRIQATLEEFPLLAYASEFWGYHAKGSQADARIQAAILQLVCSPMRLLSTMLAARYFGAMNSLYRVSIADTNGLRVCSWFGIHTVIPQLMEKGFSIDEQDNEEGETALISACRNGHVTVVDTLLNYDPNVNIVSYRGNSAIFEAVYWGKTQVVELLLTRRNDIDVNALSGEANIKTTILMLAILFNFEEIIKILVKRNDIQINLRAEDSETALLMAVSNRKTSIVAILLQHPDIRTDLCDKNGNSALAIASRKGHTEIINLLLHRMYHTTLLVDDSSSMCGLRWNIVSDVIAMIVSLTVKYDKEGVDVRFFNNYLYDEERCYLNSSEKVMQLFKNVQPDGPTLTADVLEEELNNYLYEYTQNPHEKGLNLVILTDGEPEQGQKVDDVIIKYAKNLTGIGAPLLQVSVQFVQIGGDEMASRFLKGLKNDLKAKHDLDRDMVNIVLWKVGDEKRLHEKILLGGYQAYR